MFNIFVDYWSTYALFRDYPASAVSGEENSIIVRTFRAYGLDKLHFGFLRMMTGWLSISLLGSLMVWGLITRMLMLRGIHKFGVPIFLSMLVTSALNFGAGVSNTFLWFMLHFR